MVFIEQSSLTTDQELTQTLTHRNTRCFDMKHLANQMGSIEDIKCTLKNNRWSLEDLQKSLDDEINTKQPRLTVIKMIESAIKRQLPKTTDQMV